MYDRCYLVVTTNDSRASRIAFFVGGPGEDWNSSPLPPRVTEDVGGAIRIIVVLLGTTRRFYYRDSSPDLRYLRRAV